MICCKRLQSDRPCKLLSVFPLVYGVHVFPRKNIEPTLRSQINTLVIPWEGRLVIEILIASNDFFYQLIARFNLTPSLTHLVRVKQFPEALLELHALPAAGAHVDEDEEGDDAGGDHGRIHGRQQDYCNGKENFFCTQFLFMLSFVQG